MKNKNPINASVQPIAGQQLAANWKDKTADYGGNFDRRDLENMWRQSQNKAAPVDSPTRNARLTPLSWDQLFGKN
jgi:hypothetical protein